MHSTQGRPSSDRSDGRQPRALALGFVGLVGRSEGATREGVARHESVALTGQDKYTIGYPGLKPWASIQRSYRSARPDSRAPTPKRQANTALLSNQMD
jgi:hypothetical protein